jgi:hypothetical protein
MTAAEILAILRDHHRNAAIVSEVVLNDPHWLDTYHVGADRIGTHRRIAALMIKNKIRTAIEIKTSRADYLRENDRKRQAWRAVTHRFVYATPPGLLVPEELPAGVGLWEVDSTSLEVVRRAQINQDVRPVSDQLFTAMCYRAMRNEAFVASLTNQLRPSDPISCPGWRPDGSFATAVCWQDRVTSDEPHEPETRCRCTTWCGDPGEAGCCWCNDTDVYEPCPEVGSGCGVDGGDPCDCCTPAQRAAAARGVSGWLLSVHRD